MKMGKGFTHEIFLEELKNRNIKMYEELKFITKYVSANEYMTAMSKYGLIKVKPSKLLMGRGYTIESAINKTEFWINMAKEIHGNQYNYENVRYIGNKKSVDIICEKHGAFKQRASSHLMGYGCAKCGRDLTSGLQSYTHDELMNILKIEQPDILEKITIISQYNGYNSDLFVKDRFGILKTTPCRLINGKLPNIKSAVDKTSKG
jgi:hypothetical protein